MAIWRKTFTKGRQLPKLVITVIVLLLQNDAELHGEVTSVSLPSPIGSRVMSERNWNTRNMMMTHMEENERKKKHLNYMQHLQRVSFRLAYLLTYLTLGNYIQRVHILYNIYFGIASSP